MGTIIDVLSKNDLKSDAYLLVRDCLPLAAYALKMNAELVDFERVDEGMRYLWRVNHERGSYSIRATVDEMQEELEYF